MSWGVEGVGVRFGGRRALCGVSVTVEPGSVTAVVGGDGCGKTTLLRVLAGAVVPDTGRVSLPPTGSIGFQSSAGAAYADLTVGENLRFAAAAYGVTGGVADERIAVLVERTGLRPAMTRLAQHLSGGMQQKLAMAMALVHRPAMLVLDEPTTGVDPVSRGELWRLVATSASEGVAVVLSTTYVDEAERAGTVLVLDRGMPLIAGSPDEVVAASPGMVFETAARPSGAPSWLRGGRWHVWSPTGEPVAEGVPTAVDLEDAVIVAALARRSAHPAEVRM